MQMQTQWLTTKQAAEHLGYSVKSITRFCRDGTLRHRRFGARSQYRFRPEWLEAFVAPVEDDRPVRPLPQAPRSHKTQSSGRLAAMVAKKREAAR